MTQELLVVSRETFRDVLSDDAGVKRDALAVLKEQPVQALQLLQDPAAVGLSSHAAALVLDEVAAVISVDDVAETLQKHLTPERLAELLVERGDLGSTAALVADRRVVLLALAKDLAQEPLEQVASSLFAWAQKLKDRTDWSKMLDLRLGGKSLRWYLLMYIWNASGQPGLSGAVNDKSDDEESDDDAETLADMNMDQFDEVGLDVEASMSRLTEMIRGGDTRRWEASLLREMTRRFLARQRELATQPKSVSDADWTQHFDLPEQPAAESVADNQAAGLADEIGEELK